MTRYDPAMLERPVVAWCHNCQEPYSAHLSTCPECEVTPVGMGMLTAPEQASLYQQHALAIARRDWKTL